MESNTLPLPHIILRLTDWLNVLDFCSTTELPIDQQQELLHIRRRLDVAPDVERINRDLQLELFYQLNLVLALRHKILLYWRPDLHL